MNTLTHAGSPVKLSLFDPGADDAGDESGAGPEALSTSDWIEAQAAYYRDLGSDLAGLVADRLADLARDWRCLSQGAPIGVEDFRAREEVMRDLACTPDHV